MNSTPTGAETANFPDHSASPSFRVAQTLTALIIVLAAVASAGGLFIHGLYRDPADFVPVLQGQDLVTLLAMPILAGALLMAKRGSERATMVWIGLLAYVLYTYAEPASGTTSIASS
jgi:peptidoglycan/LPS O-acetylase OafA/YrhL